MKQLSFLIAFLLTATAWAADPKPFQVEVDPKVYPPKAFAKQKHVEVKAAKKKRHPMALPSRDERETLFQCVPNLPEAVKDFDELDRDMLYMRAGYQTFAKLKEQYPKIPESSLRRLQEERHKQAKAR